MAFEKQKIVKIVTLKYFYGIFLEDSKSFEQKIKLKNGNMLE